MKTMPDFKSHIRSALASRNDVLDDLRRKAEAFAAVIHPMLRRYVGNRLDKECLLSLEPTAQTAFVGTDWNVQTHVTSFGNKDTFGVEVSFTVKNGMAQSVSAGVAFEFKDWSADNYVLLPAAVYAGNNFVVIKEDYPPVWRKRSDFRRKMPITITDLPRLGSNSTRIEQTTGDVATPCMGFYSPSRKQGFLVFTTQGTDLGNFGLTVEADQQQRSARFLITAPAVREFRQDHCRPAPSKDHACDWKACDHFTLRFLVCFFSSPNLQTLFDRFCELRKSLNHSQPVNELPFSTAWKILETKYHRDNWDETAGYFKVAPNNNSTAELGENPLCFLWQLGWVGGGQVTLPLLFQGNELSRRRALSSLDMIFERTAAPSGFFYGVGDGKTVYGDGFDCPHPHNMHMVRKSADWLFFAFKHFDLCQKLGRSIPSSWQEKTKLLAEAFVRLWENYEDFGQFVDIETGELLVGESCAGAIAPAGLAVASIFFNEPRYLDIAKAAGQKYYHDFICKGLTTGGPGEILSAPDSESAFAMLESMVKLLEITGETFWREAAHQMVRQAATWVVSYDYRFPVNSDLGRSGARTTGAVWANIQNKHAAPAICTHSGDALFRFWRDSGDPLALELIRDIAHGIPQYLSRADRPLNKTMKPGWMCERVNMSDWEGTEGIGNKLFGSCWAEVSLMLTAIEIPGLYVQPDTGFFCGFDHILAEKVAHAGDILKLRLTNDTKFDAEVKALCEESRNCHLPLKLNALFNAQVIHVPAGKAVTANFSAESFGEQNHFERQDMLVRRRPRT